MSLGTVDYGLFGVVGGLTAFISFFNTLLAGALGRFYAYSIGKASVSTSSRSGLTECRRWFSIAVMVHTIVPTVLVTLGYGLGVWAVRNFLSIPAERISDCVVLFRLVCISTFVGMVNVPFTAMYTAKQYIAELTLYSVVTTIANFLFIYHMVTTPGRWLVGYGVWMCCASVVPQLIICVRAIQVFPECRFSLAYCFDRARVRQLYGFSFWQMFGSLGWLVRAQGISIFVNKMFGPSVNAAMSVASSVNAHTSTLSAAMQGAFTPAITSACGAGDDELMRKMAFRANRLGMLLAIVFILPCALELPMVLVLWLKDPPEYATMLCLAMMVSLVIDKSSLGQSIAVYAKGRMALYQCVLGLALIMALPIAMIFAYFHFGVFSVALSLVVSACICALGRVYFGRTLAGMSSRVWFTECFAPIVLVTIASGVVGCVPHLFMERSILRIFVTAAASESAFALFCWLFVLPQGERTFVVERIRMMFRSRCQ